MTERRMNAYYYSFEPTGCDPVDEILSAVACAGKAYHHTDSWDDPPWGDPDAPTERDKIQDAANKAAAAFAVVSAGQPDE